MKRNIGFCEFTDAFRDMDRDNFSYNGLKALYEYLEQFEEDTGEEMELDVIALCCEFSEYDSAVDCINDCGYDCDLSEYDSKEYSDEEEQEALEYLEYRTMVIPFDGGIIIQDF